MGFSETYGVARSLVTYYGPIWRRSRMSRFYEQFIGDGDLCFDLGAHVGNRTGVWRRLGARVIAVEPQPKCLAVLRVLYGREEDVEIVPAAVGSSRGRTVLHTSSSTPTLSTTSTDWVKEVQLGDRRFGAINWDHKVEVDVVTVDDLIESYGEPAFCKIDVEGSEFQVLQGLTQPLSALSFEFLPVSRERTYACIDHLKSLGVYRFRWSVGETMRWSVRSWLDVNGIKEVLSVQPDEGCSGDVYAIRVE